MTPPPQIEADLAALGAMGNRYACTEAERRMLDAVKGRLPQGVDARVEGFVGHPLPLLVLGLHGIFAFAAGLLGLWWPLPGLAICVGVAVSLLGEGTGRLGLLRFWLPRLPSYNLVVPPVGGDAEIGTVVLSAPLDLPRFRARRMRVIRRPLQGVLVSVGILVALLLLRMLAQAFGTPLIALYAVALVVTAATGALYFVARRPPRGAPSEASGVVVLLELLRRLQEQPISGLTTWVVFTGCGHAHQDGMSAFLTLRGARLRKPVLVLSLDEAGRPGLSAATTEGPLWAQHHRPTGPALIERLRWAGMRIPEVDHPDPTDARAAMILGYRALALTGGDGEATPASVTRSADLIETLLRWHREDLARVASQAVKDADPPSRVS